MFKCFLRAGSSIRLLTTESERQISTLQMKPSFTHSLTHLLTHSLTYPTLKELLLSLFYMLVMQDRVNPHQWELKFCTDRELVKVLDCAQS